MVKHYSNFDWLRLVLSIQVVVIHCVGGNTVLIAPVPAFLAISGFVVLASLERRSIKSFFVSRVLRVLPLLMVMFMAIWGLFGAQEMINTVKYWIWPSGAGPINAVVWTLVFEETFYALLAALFIVGAYKRPAIPIIICASISMLAATRNYLVLPAPWYVLGASFFIGNVFYIFRHRIKPHPIFASCLFFFTLWFVTKLPYMGMRDMPYIGAHLLSFGVMLYFAIAGPQLPRLPLDLSYSIYLFHLIARYYLLPRIGLGWELFAAVLVCTVPISVAAWYLIEAPFLKLKTSGVRMPMLGSLRQP